MFFWLLDTAFGDKYIEVDKSILNKLFKKVLELPLQLFGEIVNYAISIIDVCQGT